MPNSSDTRRGLKVLYHFSKLCAAADMENMPSFSSRSLLEAAVKPKSTLVTMEHLHAILVCAKLPSNTLILDLQG